MKYLGKHHDDDTPFHDLLEVKEEEIESTPPKELENTVHMFDKEQIDLIIYNIDNPNEYVFAVKVEVEMGSTWYRRRFKNY